MGFLEGDALLHLHAGEDHCINVGERSFIQSLNSKIPWQSDAAYDNSMWGIVESWKM